MKRLVDKERWVAFASRLLPFFVIGYLALSYPQLGTSFEDGFLTVSFGLMLLVWAGDPESFRDYLRRMRGLPIGPIVGVLFLWGLAAALVAGYRFGETAVQLDLFRRIVVKGTMAFVAITGLCHRKGDTGPVFVTLAVVGFVACLDVLAGYGAGFFSISNRDAVRTFLHTRIHVNLISMKLNFIAPFFVAWIWRASGRRGVDWPVYGAGVLVLAASFFTISRAGWLGGAAGLLVLLLYSRARKILAVMCLLCALVFGLAYVGSRDVRMHVASLTERLPTVSERLSNWELCVHSVKERPVWGWGAYDKETFHRMVRMVDGPNSPILKYQYPHNVVLGMATLWGVPFPVLVLALFGWFYWKGWLASGRWVEQRPQWAALAGSTVGAFWVNGMFGEMIWTNLYIALSLACSLLLVGEMDGRISRGNGEGKNTGGQMS